MLAQDWLYGNRASTKYDAYLARHLTLPSKFNKYSTPATLGEIAERIVFTDDVPSLLYEMYDNKQITYEGMLGTVKLPYDCFWLEYSSTVGVEDHERDFGRVRYGALIQKLSGDRVGMTIVCGFRKGVIEGIYNNSLTHVLEFPQWPPTTRRKDGKLNLAFNVLYAFNRERLNDKATLGNTSLQELASIVCELIFGIFLVTHTKVYQAEDVVHSDKLKQSRDKRKRPPLLEYRKLKVHIGKGRKVYTSRPRIDTTRTTTESDEDIQHRRYHKVMGHFRHYMKHDPAYTVWIEPHYRGDPSLGVTFIEREVMK